MAALSILTDLLRIITPEEISELTTAHSGNSRIDLTDLLDQVVSGNKIEFGPEHSGAKILPFKKVEEDEELEGTQNLIMAGAGVVEYIDHFLMKKNLGETSRAKTGDTVETSVFILKEKERFKYVQDKLKKREILGLYLKNAGIDIEQEKTLREDLSKSSRSGVLINKKQY